MELCFAGRTRKSIWFAGSGIGNDTIENGLVQVECVDRDTLSRIFPDPGKMRPYIGGGNDSPDGLIRKPFMCLGTRYRGEMR